MTDLELIYEFIGKPFINPALFRQIRERGLYNIVNFLPPNAKEAKAVVHARLAKNGKYIGNEEIQIIADKIDRIQFLKQSIVDIKASEVQELIPILSEMQELSNFVLDYYKEKPF